MINDFLLHFVLRPNICIYRLVFISLYAEMAYGLQLAGFLLLDLTKNIKNENTIIGIAILKEFFIRFPNWMKETKQKFCCKRVRIFLSAALLKEHSLC